MALCSAKRRRKGHRLGALARLIEVADRLKDESMSREGLRHRAISVA